MHLQNTSVIRFATGSVDAGLNPRCLRSFFAFACASYHSLSGHSSRLHALRTTACLVETSNFVCALVPE